MGYIWLVYHFVAYAFTWRRAMARLYSFLHHLPHAAFPVPVGDAHEIDARGQRADVDGGLRAFGLVRGHTLAQHVGDFYLPQVLARDGEGGVGRIGVDGGKR